MHSLRCYTFNSFLLELSSLFLLEIFCLSDAWVSHSEDRELYTVIFLKGRCAHILEFIHIENSADRTALNRRFSRMHAMSIHLDLITVFGTLVYMLVWNSRIVPSIDTKSGLSS